MSTTDWVPNASHKVQPPSGYPPEEGRFVRGNDLSPVAVCVILRWPDDRIPPEVERLVRVGVESGAALAGTLQTENIGIEKMICNLVANPNIRYLVVCGPESPGHFTGQTLEALFRSGVGPDSKIIGSEAPTPYLYNLPAEAVDRFRQQVRLVDLLNEGDPKLVRGAVWSCYQEQTTAFRGQELFDPGAFPSDPICQTLTWRVTQPWYAPRTDQERAAAERLQTFMAEVRRKVEERQRDGREPDLAEDESDGATRPAR